MDDKTLTAKAHFLVKEARLDADAFRENTVYNADGDAIRLIANAERLEQYADTIEAQATRIEALEAVLRIEIWNGLKRNGMSDDAATAMVKERMAALESKL